MALIKEDGTKVANANSYMSVAEADAYHLVMGNTAWPQPDEDGEEDAEAAKVALKETALIQATQSLDLNYGDRYKSYPTYQDQSLQFPRMAFNINGWQVVNSTDIPKDLKNALAELALKQINGDDIFPQASKDENVKSVSKGLGPLKKDITYFKAAEVESYSGFNKVERILAPLLIPKKQTTKSGTYSL